MRPAGEPTYTKPSKVLEDLAEPRTVLSIQPAEMSSVFGGRHDNTFRPCHHVFRQSMGRHQRVILRVQRQHQCPLDLVHIPSNGGPVEELLVRAEPPDRGDELAAEMGQLRPSNERQGSDMTLYAFLEGLPSGRAAKI